MDSFLEDQDIYTRLNSIFEKKFKMSILDGKFNSDDYLLGKKTGLSATDLIYLLFYIESEFGIKVSDADIDNKRFNTIKNIVFIIKKELNKGKINQ